MTLLRTEAVCPGCRGDLQRLDTPYVVIAPCMRCGGVWLDRLAGIHLAKGTLALECKAFIRQHTALAAQPEANGGYRAAASGLERACPVCRQSLRETKAEGHDLTLDVCEHGTFFDRGELRDLHDAIMAKLAGDQAEYDALAAAQWHTRLHGWIYGRENSE